MKPAYGDLTAVDLWYARIIDKQGSIKNDVEIERLMWDALQANLPSVSEVTFERTCIWDCAHCLFQPETSSRALSDEHHLEEVVLNNVRQLPVASATMMKPALIHGGRILRKTHLPLLERVRQARPDVEVGLIDNGSCTRLLPELRRRGFSFDWLDVSLDGLETNHNRQRDPEGALVGAHAPWSVAMNGLEHAREVTARKPGAVNVLMTLTKLNYTDLIDLADLVFNKGLADRVHFALMTPARAVNFSIEIDHQEMAVVWKQLRELQRRYGTESSGRFAFKIFEVNDLAKLETVVGSRALWRSLTDMDSEHGVNIANGNLVFTVTDVPVNFYPVSLWPREAFLIDADAVSRLPHMQQFTIAELRTSTGEAKQYNVAQLRGTENYAESYAHVVNQWARNFGHGYLEQETRYFQGLRQRAKRR